MKSGKSPVTNTSTPQAISADVAGDLGELSGPVECAQAGRVKSYWQIVCTVYGGWEVVDMGKKQSGAKHCNL